MSLSDLTLIQRLFPIISTVVLVTIAVPNVPEHSYTRTPESSRHRVPPPLAVIQMSTLLKRQVRKLGLKCCLLLVQHST